MKPFSILLIILITVPVWAGEIEGVAAHPDDGTATAVGGIEWDDEDGNEAITEVHYLIPTCPVRGVLRDNFRLKTGYSHVLCKPIEDNITLDVSYEASLERFGVETGLMYQLHKVRQIGWANLFDFYVIGKVYLPHETYLGAGLGYMDTFMAENYDIESSVNQEIAYHFVGGKEYGDWFVECKVIVADLDIETYLDYDSDIELHSRWDSVNVLVGRKW